MPNPRHIASLKEGVEEWNQWRKSNPSIKPNLSRANLSKANLRNLSGANLGRANLSKANLSGADLSGATLIGATLIGADLSGAYLSEADLRWADLRRANLRWANLSEADLTEANLSKANLSRADLSGADLFEAHLRGANLTGAHLREATLNDANLSKANLSGATLLRATLIGTNLIGATLIGATLIGATLIGADLSEAGLGEADLTRASLVEANFKDADLTGCRVYGISVWNARLDGAKQSNLLITREQEPAIRVDSLEVAQFIYLLLNNAKIRHVIDTIGKKAVLILGRFTPERKVVLDSIREALRQSGFLPILFDFETPSTRDTHETIVTLAGLSRFVIADITDPKSIPQELASIVPNLPSVPVQPLLQTGYEPWGMYDHIKRYPWVLPLFEYDSTTKLLQDLELKVIAPAEEKAKELTRR